MEFGCLFGKFLINLFLKIKSSDNISLSVGNEWKEYDYYKSIVVIL